MGYEARLAGNIRQTMGLGMVHFTLLWANHGPVRRLKQGCPCPDRPRCTRGAPYQSHTHTLTGSYWERYLDIMLKEIMIPQLLTPTTHCYGTLAISLPSKGRSQGRRELDRLRYAGFDRACTKDPGPALISATWLLGTG